MSERTGSSVRPSLMPSHLQMWMSTMKGDLSVADRSTSSRGVRGDYHHVPDSFLLITKLRMAREWQEPLGGEEDSHFGGDRC
jgi:hypothetical protein